MQIKKKSDLNHYFNQQVNFIKTVMTLLIMMNLIYFVSSPSPTITYYPQEMQSDSFKFTSSSPASYSAVSTDYKGNFTITFTRIDQNVPNNYKIVLSMKGFQYWNQKITGTSNALALASASNLQKTGFFVEFQIQFKSQFYFAHFKYLAITEYIYDYVFPSYGQMTTTKDIDSSLYSITHTYENPLFYTDYQSILFLRGIDVVNKNLANYHTWNVQHLLLTSHCRIDLSGYNSILNKIYYTVVYYKKNTLYNVLPSILPIKMITDSNDFGSGGTSSLSSIVYQSSSTSMAIPINENNYLVGLLSMTGVLFNADHYINGGALKVYLNNYNTIKSNLMVFYGYTCGDGYYINNQLCAPCPATCSTCSSSRCFTCAGSIFTLSADKTYCQCPINCLSCTSAECSSCAGITTLSADKKSCLCPTNCLTCNTTECLSCNGIYVIAADKLSCQCPSNCLSCDSTECSSCNGIYEISSDKKSCQCPTNCLNCNSTECLGCTGIYQLSVDRRSCACPINCLTCNLTQCQSCNGIYVLTPTKTDCQCPPNCLSCNSTECALCDGVYMLSTDKKSCQCPTNCMTCNTAQCYQCVGIMTLSSDKSACLCPTNCASCTSIECQSCNGIYVLSVNKTSCQCPPNCLTCNSFQCFQCSGIYEPSSDKSACQCPEFCVSCNSTQCQVCLQGYKISPDRTSCLAPIWGCLYIIQFPPSSKNFQCAFCNYAHKIVLNTTTKKCQCTSGYQLDQASGKCVQICGDGLVYEAECDDGNTISNDGCSDKCQIEKWFMCNSNVKPTFCNSLMTVSYEIEKIERTEQCESCAKVVLKPKNTFLPYPLYYQHFDPRQSGTPSHFLFSIAINKPPLPQQTFVPPYKILSVTDNYITLGFTFQFTVQGLNATIQLNYEKTRYLNTTQKLQFTLKGANHKLEFNNYYNVYENIQSSLLVTAIISLICLLIGLFVPKFIGLETILTMQLIFYSQMLVQSEQKWPYGFMVLKYLKFSTGYNEFLDLSEYYPLEYMYKRYFHLEISKTIAQNIQANFVIVMLAFFAFFLLNYIRTGKQTQLKELISDKKEKCQEIIRQKQIKNLIKVNNRWLKVNEVTYWMIAQLSVWSILPFMSCFSAQTLIDNKVVNYKYPNSIFLKLDTPLFLVITTVVFSILLNHFKNLYLSIRTQHKIHERPEELLYKQLLILYLFIVGIIIFFFNDLQIANSIPISLFVLILNLGFILILLKIKPYKQSLRIHQVSLIINHLLYAVFMVIINLINFLDTIKEIIILCLGYFIAGCVGMLILLTILRLYYEIRFGERLEKEIQLQRQKAEQQEKELQKKLLQQTRINLEYEAKQRLNQIQKQRDQNKYLIQTQVMQEQKASLLNWLQKRNIWSDKQKEKYYFKQFHEKPFQWLKKNDKAQFQRRIQEHQMKKKLDEQKKKARQQNPDFYNVASKLRFEFEEKMKNKAKKKGKVSQENQIKKEKRNTEND